MLASLGLMMAVALILGTLCTKIKLPGLLGMLVGGVILGPEVLNLISPDLLNISAELRRFALIVILTRAGLSLDLGSLKKAGRPAVMLSFVPALFEIGAVTIIATLILRTSYLESAIVGSVLAAVSPAVIVPRMLRLKNEGYGTDKAIPQMITAGASVDDVAVIIIFTALTGAAATGSVDLNVLWKLPVSIALGVGVGIALGIGVGWVMSKLKLNGAAKMLGVLALSFGLDWAEGAPEPWVPFSGLLAIVAMACAINVYKPSEAQPLGKSYSSVWVFGELVLFSLVGAQLDLGYLAKSFWPVLAVLAVGLAIRMVGVYACMIKTPLNQKERLFCAISYTPKATVQAAIGSIPLMQGLPCGEIVLTCAVIAIVVTAPLGAFGIDMSYKKLLNKSE